MADDTRTVVERIFRAFEAKDLQTALDCFAEDALVFDPHYPQPAMQGKAAIRQGLAAVLGMVKQPGFTIGNFWSGETSGAAEVDTHHVFQDGSDAQFPQVFVFETQDGLLTRFQAYTPYPPPAQQP